MPVCIAMIVVLTALARSETDTRSPTRLHAVQAQLISVITPTSLPRRRTAGQVGPRSTLRAPPVLMRRPSAATMVNPSTFQHRAIADRSA
jgi:hypothetical protein